MANSVHVVTQQVCLFLFYVTFSSVAEMCHNETKRTDLSYSDLLESRLLRYILTDYEPRAQPPDTNNPIQVDVLVTNLLSVDPITQVVTVSVRIQFTYGDRRLRWDESEYSSIQETLVGIDDIWIPPFVQVGSGKVSRLGFDKMKLAVNQQGMVYWGFNDVFSVPCKLKVSTFPFDRHACSLKFEPITLHKTHIPRLTCKDWSHTADLSELVVTNPEWNITNTECTVVKDRRIVVKLHIERKPLFHFVNLFAPIVCLAIMNSFTFLLPVDAGDRIGFCVTIFLAFTVFISFVATTVPSNSDYVPYLSYILVIQIVVSILTLLMNIFVGNLRRTAPDVFGKMNLPCVDRRNDRPPNDKTANVTGNILDARERDREHNAMEVDHSEEKPASAKRIGKERIFDIICFIVTLTVSLVPFIVYLVLVLS